MVAITTIQLKKSTYNMLKRLGKKGETFEDIVRKLLENYETAKDNSNQDY